MSGYEFNEQENAQITAMVKQMRRFCYLVGVIALVVIFNQLVAMMRDEAELSTYAGIVVGIVQLAIAIVLYLPINNFENIVNTSGNDIGELMTGLGELRGGFGLMAGLLAINLLLIIIQVASRLV